MKYGSLFSGIGGFDSGFDAAGFNCAWQCEIEPSCISVLERHYPNVKRYTDIQDVHSGAYLDKAVREWYIPLNGVEYTDAEAQMAGSLKKLTPEQALEAVRMYERGLSLAPIADYFHVSRQAMWDLLRRRTKLRPQKRFAEENNFHRGGALADDHAQNLLESAIKQGVLTRRDTCEQCGTHGEFRDGRSKIQAHHDDYNKPLDVRWLCQTCHHKWHKHNKAKPRQEKQELAAVDVICGGFP